MKKTMTATTNLVVWIVAACLCSALALPKGKGSDPVRKDLFLTLTSGSETILTSWNVTLPNVTVTWKDQYDVAGKIDVHNASEALITELRPSTTVTVAVYAHSIRNPPTACATTRTLEQDIHLTLTPGTESIFARWDVAFPRVNVTWKDNCGEEGIQILDDASEATIHNLRPCTFVTVSIFPEDSENSASATKIIRTLEKAPPPVSHLEVPHTAAQHVSLAWERPDTKCPITVYIITYSGVAKSGHRPEHTGEATISSGSATNCTIDGLHPDTNYTIRLAALTEAGKGQQTIVNASTSEGVPSSPLELTSASRSGNSISVTWKEPEEPNGVIRNYSVNWYENGMEVDKTAVPHLTHTIVGLSPCREYMVRVAASTGAGEGEYQEVRQNTAAVPPSVHNAICTIAPDSQVVTAIWSKSESACLITGYELFWQNDAEQPFASINAFTAGPSPSYVAEMPSEEHNTVCVAAMLHEERGERSCCVKMTHPKHSGRVDRHLTSVVAVVVVVVVVVVVLFVIFVAAVLLILRKSSATSQQVKGCMAIGNDLSNELASSSQNVHWWNYLLRMCGLYKYMPFTRKFNDV